MFDDDPVDGVCGSNGPNTKPEGCWTMGHSYSKDGISDWSPITRTANSTVTLTNGKFCSSCYCATQVVVAVVVAMRAAGGGGCPSCLFVFPSD